MSVLSCHANVSLDSPMDGGVVAEPPADVRACPAHAATTRIATLDPSLGHLRAIAAHGGVVAAAFALADDSGAVALASGGQLTELTSFRGDPTAIAFDGAYVYVACRASARVHRVRSGEVITATSQPDASSITITGDGRALWTTAGSVVTWSFAGGAPTVVAKFPEVRALAERDGTLYLAGRHALAVLAPGEAAPVKIASVCGPGAITVEEDHVFCIDDGALHRVQLGAGDVSALVGGIRGGTDVVVARGRAFYRSEHPEPPLTTVESVPTDGIGGRTVVDIVKAETPLATDGCSLFYSDGEAIHRRAL